MPKGRARANANPKLEKARETETATATANDNVTVLRFPNRSAITVQRDETLAMPKGSGRARARARANGNRKLEKAKETATANDNVIVSRSRNSSVITEHRDETLAKEFSAKMPSLSRLECGFRRDPRSMDPSLSPSSLSLSLLKSGVTKEERSLEVCLRLIDQTFTCFSIPGITTTLNSLSSSSKRHRHRHNFDETPCPLDTNYDISTNRFPVIFPDFKGPFPLPPCITGPLFCTTVVGHKLFLVGGDPHDIQGLDDINTERNSYPYAPPSPPKRYYYSPPPRNRISAQLYNLNMEYLRRPLNFQALTSSDYYSSESVNDPHTFSQPQWDECDFQTTALTLTLPSPVVDHTMDPTIVTGHVDKALAGLCEDPTEISTSYTGTNSFLHWDELPLASTSAPESPKVKVKGICHKIWTFDLYNPDLGWSEGESLISPRIYPILVPYQGKLYAFSGNHPSLTFAEVYDPISAVWTKLPAAPFRRLPDSQMYVVPLKGWDKLWVFGVLRPVDYFFDVITQKWQKYRGARDILPHLTDHNGLVSALNSEKHMVVYWINDQEVMYAYNLSTNQLFKGVIFGTDSNEESLGSPLGLHHLRHDIFCLIGCTYLSDPLLRTIVHVTVLQVSIKPPSDIRKASSKIHKTPPNPMTTTILACFAYTLKGDIRIHKSYIMSKMSRSTR